MLALGVVAVLAVATVAAGVLAITMDTRTVETTLEFEDVADERGLGYQFVGHQVVNGNAGAYVADYDNDDWQDVLLVGNETRGPVLYRNTGGSFEVSGALPDGLDDRRIHSVLFVDYDADGWKDLFVLPDPSKPSGGYTSSGGGMSFASKTTKPILLHNVGGEFINETTVNTTIHEYPIGATAGDYNGDGCQDVFIYHNGDWSKRTPAGYRNPISVGNITNDNGEPNSLLRGTCSAKFEDVTEAAGIRGERWSLAASFVDVNGDSLPDIHVGNDFNEDVLYLNQGDGTFAFRKMGDGTDRNAMSSEIGDVNGDGWPDVYVTNIGMASRSGADVSGDTGQAFDRQAAAESPRYAKGNQLQVNQGNGTFVDRAEEYNVKRAPFVWGWAAIMADLDNDGDLDVVHANNEMSSVTTEGSGVMLRWEDTPPGVWENVGTDTDPSFATLDAETTGLPDMNSRGMVRVDFDRDGDLDIVSADETNQAKLLENVGRTGNWLSVSLEKKANEPQPLGTRVYLTTGNETRVRFLNARVDFLSQEPRVAHFGLSDDRSIAELRVVWPDGTERTFDALPINSHYTVSASGSIEETSR